MDFKHYLYQNIREDTGKVFYVGIGSKKENYYNTYKKEYSRAYVKTKSGRSKFWHRVVSKTNYKVEILMESDDYEVVKQLEVSLIALYGRKNLGKGELVNLTDGGEDSKNIVVSKETGLKISEANKGRIPSKETKSAISLGNTGKKRSMEVRKAKSDSMSGEKHINAKITLNYETGIYYGTIGEAAIAHNISRTALSDMLNGKRRNKTTIIFAESIEGSSYLNIPKLKDTYIPHRTDDSIYKQKLTIKNKKGKEEFILCKETGIFYNTTREASEAMNINLHSLRHKLKGFRKNNTSLIRV